VGILQDADRLSGIMKDGAFHKQPGDQTQVGLAATG